MCLSVQPRYTRAHTHTHTQTLSVQNGGWSWHNGFSAASDVPGGTVEVRLCLFESCACTHFNHITPKKIIPPFSPPNPEGFLNFLFLLLLMYRNRRGLALSCSRRLAGRLIPRRFSAGNGELPAVFYVSALAHRSLGNISGVGHKKTTALLQGGWT